ncbi:hypothetical protein GGR58DRAFT_526145 [Xylaria digitata]|nr:hypothetical protein GGR58DRAFT_526145 [Xylaria digitata]
MDSKHSVIGLFPRGLGYANTEVVSVRGPVSTVDQNVPVLPRAGTGTGPGTRAETGTGTAHHTNTNRNKGDYRNYHGHKYSNKNWNQQQPFSGTGAQPSKTPLSKASTQVSIHPQSALVEDLVEAPQLLQLDPSQSHWQRNHDQRSQLQQQQQHQQHQGHQQPSSQHADLAVSSLSSSSQQTHHPHSHVHTPQGPQPYRRPSQPPRLPPLAPSLSSLSSISLSPFDPFHTRDGDNYLLSFAASPTPATSHAIRSAIPRLPVQTDDIVSPISETRSSTPVFRSLDRVSEPTTAHSPATQSFTRFTTPTTLKRWPTSDSSTRASLLDDRDFQLSLGVTERAEHPSPSVTHFTSAAVTSAVAQDVAHLTDDRSDDWFRFTVRESTISKYTNSNSFAEAHSSMTTVAMMGDEPGVPEQYQQQGQGLEQEQSSHFTAIPSSFTPLPPIRRTSTFDVLRKKGLVDYDSDTAPSPIEKDNPLMPSGPASPAQQASNSQLPSAHGASHSSPHNSMQQPRPQPQQNPDPNPHAQGQSAMPQQPDGFAATAPTGQPGMPQHPIMQMHPHQMVMNRGGPAGQQVAPGHMINGKPIISLPGGRQWIEQESHLAEPLNPSNRNRPGNSPKAYPDTYDKEIEGEGARPPFGGSSQPVQTRPPNTSNPPTAATRFPGLFPNPSTDQPAFPQNQGQVPLQQHPLMRRQNGNPGQRGSFGDMALSKELDVHIDHVSVSSAATEDVNDKHRRGSGARFVLGHRRNSSSTTPGQQGQLEALSEKKRNFFTSVTGIGHSLPKSKPNPALARPQPYDHPDQVSLQNSDHSQGKKRLSELKGMIKGVGNAKEGAKDDQPLKVETVYESRESMQGPPRTFTAPPGIQGAQRQPVPYGFPTPPGPFGSQVPVHAPGSQAPMQLHPSQMQPGMASQPPFMGASRANTSGPPQSGQNQPVRNEESGKKSSGGGFLGGLFNKQGNKTKDAKPQSPQQTPPPNQRPMQPPAQAGSLPFRPGHMQLPGQQLGPHPMLAGQPPIQRGPPGQSPSPILFQDSTQPSPSLQTAQVVTIRRPSEITVASQNGVQPPNNQRPNMPSPQRSQGNFKQQAGPSPLGQTPGRMGLRNDGGIAASQTSPQLSDDSPLEKPAIGNMSAVPRFSPNRKPVGSGVPKGDGPFMTSAVPPATVSSTASPSPVPGEQRAPSQLSMTRQSPQPGSLGGFNSMRQPSLPSPEPSPVPTQSNHSSSPRMQENQFARDSADSRDSGQGLGVFSNGLSSSGPTSAPGPGNAPNGLTWIPNGTRPSVPPLASPSAMARAPPPRTPSSPVPSVDQGKLSKFFGAYDGGKPAAQPQASKEKSAASKFLGAFKRSSKQNEPTPPQPRPQTSPQMPQQNFRPAVPGPGAPGGIPNPDNIPTSSGVPIRPFQVPGQLGQGRGMVPTQIPAQMQAGRGQPGPISPQGMLMAAQAGRGQIPPGMMMQGGRGQMPPQMFTGAGPPPPHMQRPMGPGKQGNEPRYDQVPIPRGYEAVHGYGPGGMLAFSPYNAGRPGHPPIQFAQYPPGFQQGFPQRQLDPRMMRPSQAGLPPGVAPNASQMVPQGVPNNMAYQGAPQQPQLQGATQSPPPMPQGFQSGSAQNQQPPQQFSQLQQIQQPGQFSSPGQGQIPNQIPQNPQFQQSQPQGSGFQQEPSPGPSQVQPYSWTGTPQNAQSPATSVQQLNPPTPSQIPQTSVRAGSRSDTPASDGTSTPQSQHTAGTAPSQPSQLAQASSTRQTSPTNQMANPSAQISTASSQGQPEAVIAPTRSPGSTTTASSGLLRSQDAARLTSRMSVSKHATRSDASFGSDKPADRTLTVSPEPPGPRHGPIHQVSEQNLSVNVERANNHVRYGSEDIYDATPRLNSSTPRQGEDQAHENTKYAGSEKGRIVANGGIGLGVVGAGAAAAAAAVVVPEDNMSFLDGPDDSEPDENADEKRGQQEEISPPQRTAAMNLEPEEKILVDQPVELAAVNDDDDGIPTMSATSYPGQEWNPYGAGEFGDWE